MSFIFNKYLFGIFFNFLLFEFFFKNPKKKIFEYLKLNNKLTLLFIYSFVEKMS